MRQIAHQEDPAVGSDHQNPEGFPSGRESPEDHVPDRDDRLLSSRQAARALAHDVGDLDQAAPNVAELAAPQRDDDSSHHDSHSDQSDASTAAAAEEVRDLEAGPGPDPAPDDNRAIPVPQAMGMDPFEVADMENAINGIEANEGAPPEAAQPDANKQADANSYSEDISESQDANKQKQCTGCAWFWFLMMCMAMNDAADVTELRKKNNRLKQVLNIYKAETKGSSQSIRDRLSHHHLFNKEYEEKMSSEELMRILPTQIQAHVDHHTTHAEKILNAYGYQLKPSGLRSLGDLLKWMLESIEQESAKRKADNTRKKFPLDLETAKQMHLIHRMMVSGAEIPENIENKNGAVRKNLLRSLKGRQAVAVALLEELDMSQLEEVIQDLSKYGDSLEHECCVCGSEAKIMLPKAQEDPNAPVTYCCKEQPRLCAGKHCLKMFTSGFQTGILPDCYVCKQKVDSRDVAKQDFLRQITEARSAQAEA